MEKRAYIVRYGAFGDHLHMTNVIKALDLDGWHITFEYNLKGAQIHTHNPRIDAHVYFEPGSKKNMTRQIVTRKEAEHEEIKRTYDRYINLQGSLEGALIAGEDTPEYFWPLWKRRAKNTHTCYYDQAMKWAGFTHPKYMGWGGEVYFTDEEENHVKKQLEPYQDKFIILWALRGTMQQKAVYPLAKDICNEWLRRYPDSVIITTGDEFCQAWEWPSSEGTTIAPAKGLVDESGKPAQLVHKSARMPFRQALNIAKYADLVITPETGLGIGAGAFGTPKIMLLTAASIKNIVGNDRNDFSLQSPAWCSPCTRAIYNTRNCGMNPETGLPICVDFPKDMVLDRMEEVYLKEN